MNTVQTFPAVLMSGTRTAGDQHSAGCRPHSRPLARDAGAAQALGADNRIRAWKPCYVARAAVVGYKRDCHLRLRRKAPGPVGPGKGCTLSKCSQRRLFRRAPAESNGPAPRGNEPGFGGCASGALVICGHGSGLAHTGALSAVAVRHFNACLSMSSGVTAPAVRSQMAAMRCMGTP